MFEPIKVIPKVVVGELISTTEISKRLCQYLDSKNISGMIGAKVQLEKNNIKVTLAMSTRSKMLMVNPITKLADTIKVKDPYTLTPELKEILAPLTTNNPTVVLFESKRDARDARVIIHLVPSKVFDTVIEQPEEGYTYNITKAIPQKGNGLLEFTKVRKGSNAKKHKPNNNHNNNNNRKQYYGNRNNR